MAKTISIQAHRTITEEVEVQIPYYFKDTDEPGYTVVGEITEAGITQVTFEATQGHRVTIDTLPVLPGYVDMYLSPAYQGTEADFLEALDQARQFVEEQR